MFVIGSFEYGEARHLILAAPTDRTGVVDTFCGKQLSRQDGYCYVNIPQRSQACPNCVRMIEDVLDLINRPVTQEAPADAHE